MHADEGAVDTDRLGRLGELDRLPMGVRRGPGPRPRGGLPVPEGEEPDLLHKVKYRGRNRPGLRGRDAFLLRRIVAHGKVDFTVADREACYYGS
jgi:hypothetical protein